MGNSTIFKIRKALLINSLIYIFVIIAQGTKFMEGRDFETIDKIAIVISFMAIVYNLYEYRKSHKEISKL